ncbi:MAG: hypothetical protein II229_06230, partial [Clostridia bacterium]|nr:hypothetical protein [Clostridia bacterium]
DESVWIVIDPASVVEKYQYLKNAEEMIIAGRWEFLPLPWELDSEAQATMTRSELKIPLATLSSSLSRSGRQIRIQNKEGERGRIGRHLSPWKASWITRRIGWNDNSSSYRVYFRRDFALNEIPDAARICLAAVNEWELCINGETIASSTEGLVASTIDVAKYLRKGANALCITVTNRTPLVGATILQRDEPIASLLLSLVAELEMVCGEEKQVICTDGEWITCESMPGDWTNIEFKPAVAFFEASARLNQAPALKPHEWAKAWERGKLPMKPFGDLPYFGEEISYPQRVCYGIELPCGTAAVRYPDLTGSHVEIMIDGIPALFKNGVCTLIPDGNTHYMQVMLDVSSPEEGLHTDLSVEMVSERYALCDWRLHGLKWYSGFASYKTRFAVAKKSGRYLLDLGDTCHQAEVWINGKKAGERVWAPYHFDVTELLRHGENEITVIVSNSAGVWHQFALLDEGEAIGWNRYWNYDNIQRDSKKLISGLIGPVRLFRQI